MSMNIVAGVLGVTTVGFMVSTIVLATKSNVHTHTAAEMGIKAPTEAEPKAPVLEVDMTVPTAPRSGANPCDNKKPTDGFAPGDGYFNSVKCMIDGVANALEQAGGNVTMGYQGNVDVDGRVPITTPFFEAGLCAVNVHWHLGSEHLSVGEYDTEGHGPSDIHERRAASGKVRLGSQCHHYDENDVTFTTEYDWKFCHDMEVGQTYEVHWPQSAAGACGTVDQYQSPFYDGVFCNDGIITLNPLNTYTKIGVQAQVFTIVNDENYYYPNLFNGMLVDDNVGMGKEITKYTGSTTGTSVNNTICSKYTPITWQVDRKCNKISASTFDKMCAEMKSQKDDMSSDLHPHGAREHTSDDITADNFEYRYLRTNA